MPFDPKTQYTITQNLIPILDFHKYRPDYIVRPPYQRKSVWRVKKQQNLLDSLFRRYYIPHVVLRQIRIDDDKTILEVIDGQQRITTVQEFFDNQLKLPNSLADVHKSLAGAYYKDLSTELQRFIDDKLKYQADIIGGIDDPKNIKHQKIASEIFWRLQQGESLNYMEIAHSRLSSLVRNFIVRYGDDYDFDYDTYQSVDINPTKHPFFKIYDRKNDRMQHLSLLARLLLIERANGPTDTKDKMVADLIDETQQDDGIGNTSYEKSAEAKRLIGNLDILYSIFKDDSIISKQNGVKEFDNEYFVVSVYLLCRHLAQYYVFDKKEKDIFRDFVLYFYQRRSNAGDNDNDILSFSENSQQSKTEMEARDRIIRQAFFEYVSLNGYEMLTKDRKRAFSEADKIKIYRRDNGICQECRKEGKSENEARVSWSEFEADHIIPHSKGGLTNIENAQVLCRIHNRRKGAN